MTVPIWVLPLNLPVAGVAAALFVSAIFGPLVNAPLIGVITTRTPEVGQTLGTLPFAWAALRGQPTENRNDVSPAPSIWA